MSKLATLIMRPGYPLIKKNQTRLWNSILNRLKVKWWNKKNQLKKECKK
jgi:hypothetical protein